VPHKGLGAPQARPAPHPTAQKTRGGDPAGAERGKGVPARDGDTGAPAARSMRGGGDGGSGGAKPPGLNTP
jgi:hypothetical protein